MDTPALTLSEQEHATISAFIKTRYGVNLAEKKPLVEGRLSSYIVGKGFKSFGEYFEFAKSQPSQREMTSLIDRVTTNHTFFMRESAHFDFLASEVMPWVEGLGEKDLRIWCAGCASGEEAYTLSIFALERFGGDPAWDTTVLASDISENALRAAAAGVYSSESVEALPKEWLPKYFDCRPDGSVRVKPRLRGNTAFRKINLMESFGLRRPIHAIFCRNVMIYFDSDAKRSLAHRFYDALMPQGYLFVGHSESLSTIDHGFEYVNSSIYRKPLHPQQHRKILMPCNVADMRGNP